jgi:succinate-acetate transporter protein
MGSSPGDPPQDADDRADAQLWAQRSRIAFTPVAAPSILGLFGFAGATFMVASLLAGWWGNPAIDSVIVAPFAVFFGGLAQLLAGMWSYRARDGVATAMHGTWGASWLAWGVLVGAVALRILPPAVLVSRAFGFWFIVLALVTLFGALAALAESLALFTVLGLLAAGSVLLAIAFVGGYPVLVVAGRLGAGRLGGRRVLHRRRDDVRRLVRRTHRAATGHIPGGGQHPWSAFQ